MATESQALLRNAFEFLIFAMALVNDSNVLERLADQDTRERVKQAKGILKVRGALLSEEQRVALGLSLTATHGTNLTSTNHFFEKSESEAISPVFGPFA